MTVLWCSLVLFATWIVVIGGQPSTQGFISIDCGAPSGSSYQDNNTGIHYVSDDSYIETGINYNISKSYQSPSKQSSTLRSFPKGTRNCYMLRNVTKGSVYLLRATFLYGNYDGNQTAQISTPLQFNLNLDTTFWRKVNITNASQEYAYEVVTGARNDFMWLCLVNINAGTPFISALELRPLPANLYSSVYSYQSNAILFRLNYGPTEDIKIRYPDDPYDRIWSWYQYDTATLTSISTKENIEHSGSANYDAPNAVLQTALVPISSPNLTTAFYDTPLDRNFDRYRVVLYMAELQNLTMNQSRQFYIYRNDRSFGFSSFSGFQPEYLKAKYEYENYLTTYVCTLAQKKTSTLPPILNAIEVYWDMSMAIGTNVDDVNAMMDLKAEYGIVRNWNGDPCYPQNVSWNGVNCKGGSQIYSLNLSYSGLRGMISGSFARLESIAYLDLSHNNLSGDVPDSFTRLTSLQVLNLSGNIIGHVPDTLLKRNSSGSLLLLVDSCINCEATKGKRSSSTLIIAIVVAAVAIAVSISAVLLMLIWYKRIIKRMRSASTAQNFDTQVHSEIKRFTYSEVKDMTNKFSCIIGRGGFGVVYLGYLQNQTEVAVKVCSPESGQGSKQFLAEIRSLSLVHHRNLVTLIGYCKEGDDLAVIYEYMSRGSLFDYLRGKGSSSAGPLNWRMRLNIILEAAQGLDYLHAGCGIVHRDVKSSNILLGQDFEAKVSDLGLARMFSAETNSSLITLCGTPGYIDPEYQVTFVLTEKSDVYSFGVILFEIVTGETPILNSTENMHIVKHVQEKLNKWGIEDVIDSRLKGAYNLQSVQKVVELAMMCTSDKSIDRPTMADVVIQLKESLRVEEQYQKEMAQSSDKSDTNASSTSVSLIGTIQSIASATR